jgi:hypothetical protein
MTFYGALGFHEFGFLGQVPVLIPAKISASEKPSRMHI